MNFLKEKYYETRLSKKAVEKSFEQAQLEIEQDNYSKGLMGMAKSKSKNNHQRAEAFYLDLRAEQLMKQKIQDDWKKRVEEDDGSAISISNRADRIALLIFIIAVLVLIGMILTNNL